jgi:hypothetical protein
MTDNTEVRDLVRQIATALGTDWEVVETDEPMRHGAHIRNAEGVYLFIRDEDAGYARANEKGKVTIDGSPYKVPGVERDDYPYRPYGTKPPRISVSKSRGPDTIAKEIRRRLLADVEREHNETIERMLRRKSNERSQASIVAELAALIPGAYVRGGEVSSRIGSGSLYGDLTVSHDGTKVEAKLRGLTVEQAKRVAAILAEG